MKQWYALYTKPNVEYQVAAALEGRGIETYLPEIASARTRRRSGRQPFFPCYLFIKVDFQRVRASSVQWMPGLRRVVAYGDRPVPLPDEVIGLMRRKLEALNAGGGWPGDSFQPGDTVRIKSGPLQGMLAIFEGPSRPSERVRVLLAFLSHAKRVELPAADLEKAPPEAGDQAPKPRRRRRTRGRGRRIRSG